MRVSVLGAGYVGVVTGACLAERGHDVTVADIDADRVAVLEAGRSPIYEPGLDEIVARLIGGRLRATTDVRMAVADSELTIVSVGTPVGSDGIDLRHLESAVRAAGSAIAAKDEYHVVAVKSTVVPGTTDEVVIPVVEESSGKRAGQSIGVGVNPEFLTEGTAVRDFREPDRLVFGSADERVHRALTELYSDFAASIPRMHTTTRTAEMIKYASNALLATAISFSNEIADLCSAVGGADVVDVMRGVHLSDYLSPMPHGGGRRVRAPITSFLEAGCGFGGSCLPKDVRALVAEGERHGLALATLRAVLQTNSARADALVDLVDRGLGGLEGRRATVLGLAFKPDTDDVRETPAVPIVRRLVSAGVVVTLHDPVVHTPPEALQDLDVHLVEDLEDAIADADAVVIATRWAAYQRLPEILAGRSRQPLVVDGRRMLDPDSVERYSGIGR
jgi:UDPglucose 6-dehydrogenase/GDP-mannose 6-dehydrogenase